MIESTKKNFKAFSYNEILLVAAISAILMATISPVVLSSIKRNELNDTEVRFIELIKMARRKSLEGYKNIDWSVCHNSVSIFLSDPSCSELNKTANYNIPAGVTVSAFNTITFSKFTGEIPLSVEISLGSLTNTRVITINQAGGYYEN